MRRKKITLEIAKERLKGKMIEEIREIKKDMFLQRADADADRIIYNQFDDWVSNLMYEVWGYKESISRKFD